MSDPITVAQAREKFYKRYQKHLPLLLLTDEHTWSFPLNPPTGATAFDNQQHVASWIASWQDVQFCQVNWHNKNWHRVGLGTQRLPTRAMVSTSQELATAADRSEHFQQVTGQFQQLMQLVTAGVSTKETIAAQVHNWQNLKPQDLEILINAALWLAQHPKSGLTPRAVPVEGMHSKWLETHLRLMKNLLGTHDLGLQLTDFTVRLTVLDPELRRHPKLRDLEVPFASLATACLAPETIIMVENKETFLILPDFPPGSKVIGIWGKGYEASRIVQSPLFDHTRIIYFGDLDADGFTILNQIRAERQQVISVFMDDKAVTTYHHLGVKVAQQHRHLPQLTATEHQAYSRLLAEELRIEQERINSHTVIATLLDKGLS